MKTLYFRLASYLGSLLTLLGLSSGCGDSRESSSTPTRWKGVDSGYRHELPSDAENDSPAGPPQSQGEATP